MKLLQLQKKGSLKQEEYMIVPKLIQKEMNQYKVDSDIDRHRLTMIKNQYFEGYLETCLSRRNKMDKDGYVIKAI